MATALLQQFDNGAVRVEYDYNDASHQVMLIRCINNGTGNVRVTIWRNPDGLLADQKYYPPGTGLISKIKNGLVVSFDGGGNPVFPYGYSIEYPVGG